jgi:ABC-type branched-subunit amino acid transport system substrate-binding protein
MNYIGRRVMSLAVLGASSIISGAGWAADPGITADKITIGSALPLQSGLAAGATGMRDGADAYFQMINAGGGVQGRKIEWIVENDSYNPQQAVAVVKKLVDRDEVFALVSTLGTVTGLAYLPFLVDREVPLINPAAGHVLLNKPTAKNVFAILPLASEIGESMAEYAVKDLGARRLAIFFQNDQFGKDQRDGVVEYLRRNGMKAVGEASYNPSDVDVSAQAIALKETSPDAIIFAVIPKHGALFMKEAQRLGWKPKVVAHSNMADPVVIDLAGPEALEGIYVNLISAAPNMDKASVKKANEILAKYHPQTKPGHYPYLGMAGAMIFAEGANRAGKELSRASLIAALETLHPYEPGIVPPINWSATYHGGPAVFGYAQWKDGKLAILKSW